MDRERAVEATIGVRAWRHIRERLGVGCPWNIEVQKRERVPAVGGGQHPDVIRIDV